MSSNLYVQRAIADVEKELADVGLTLKNNAKTSFRNDYRPELDWTPKLDDRRVTYF